MEKTEIKEIVSEIGNVYPVRYERRSAIAPLLWICGATFTTALIWCTVNVYLSQDVFYTEFVCIFAGIIAGVSFLAAISSAIYAFVKHPDKLHSEHYLIEMRRMDKSQDKEDSNGQEKKGNDKEQNEPVPNNIQRKLCK